MALRLMNTLRNAHPDLDEHLKLGHSILKDLDRRQEIERLNARLRPHPAPPRPKVGRNDPCPCGSGRKYKCRCPNKAPQTADNTPPPPA